ncbi:hypothetical protein RK21_01088 [Pseudomonas plecoglossicida]|nr:hypothetical protein RK21_01088 [Pseudomonas plecoglossicida]
MAHRGQPERRASPAWPGNGKVSANIAIFRIKPDGILAIYRKYDMSEAGKSLIWVEALQL